MIPPTGLDTEGRAGHGYPLAAHVLSPSDLDVAGRDVTSFDDTGVSEIDSS